MLFDIFQRRDNDSTLDIITLTSNLTNNYFYFSPVSPHSETMPCLLRRKEHTVSRGRVCVYASYIYCFWSMR